MGVGNKLAIGLTAVSSSVLVQNTELPTSTEVKDIISIIVQIAIGVATIVGIFKKKTPITTK